MEINHLKINALEVIAENQFHAITDDGAKFFNISDITFNGKKYSDINALATDLKVNVIEQKTEQVKIDLSNIDIDSLSDEQLKKIAIRLKYLT